MTQDTISGNAAKWAGGSHADNGDNDVAKMHNEKRHKKETRSPKERAQDTIRSEGAHTRIETERAGRHLPRLYVI